MPIYSYACKECGHADDYLVDFDAEPPECCNRPMHKEIVPCTFHLKGLGWPGKEKTMNEVICEEKKRDAEYEKRKRELRADGVPLERHK